MVVTRETWRPKRRIGEVSRVVSLRIQCDRIQPQDPIDEPLRVRKLRIRDFSCELESDVLTEVYELTAETQSVLAMGIGGRLKELISVCWPEPPRASTRQRSRLVQNVEERERGRRHGITIAPKAVGVATYAVKGHAGFGHQPRRPCSN